MKVLLLKLLLLLLFLVLLFLFLRVLEGVAWYETGLVLSQIVDPLSLSVRKLKVLLDGRGISYDGVVEKQELTGLVQTSGDIMEGELLLLEQEDAEQVQSTSFISGGHFYEEVEDKKDSVWLIQVMPRGHAPLLERQSWKTVVKKVSLFGIRTGTFDCAHDNRFCRQRDWTRPILILAMPQGLNQKDSVIMATYPSANHKAPQVLNWVNTRLARTVHRVGKGKLVKEWLDASQTQTTNPQLKLLLLSEDEDTEAPLFFSAISLKYSGRVTFGQALLTSKNTQELLSEKLKIDSQASRYLLVTPEGIVIYGSRDGEYLNHYAMDVYLRTIYPQANDFFTLSFVVANALCVLELALNQGDVLAKRTCHFIWLWVKYNAVLLMLWLPLLALTQITFLEPAFQFCHKLLRMSSQTALASQFRCMWIMHSNHGSLILLSFFAFCAVICYICRSRGSVEDDNNNGGGTSSSQWLQSTLIYYYNMLVRPDPGYTSVLLNNARVEEGVNWNRVNRLLFPSLFLMADISQDYLKELPTWQYCRQEVLGETAAEKCRCCWHTCSLNDGKHMQENGKLLHKFFEGRDKLPECKDEKNGSVGNKKHPCHLCLSRLFVDPKRGEPFLVTNSQEISDFSQGVPQEGNSNILLPLPPENLGSTSLDQNSEAKNLQSGKFEKPSYKEKPYNEVKMPQFADDKEAKCDCRSDPKHDPDVKSTFDPWPEGMVESFECPICLEPYTPGVVLCGLPCGHAFHQQCVMVWLRSNRNHCCPNCRWPAYKTNGAKLSKHKE